MRLIVYAEDKQQQSFVVMNIENREQLHNQQQQQVFIFVFVFVFVFVFNIV
jgi:hypothetical protein